jgi:asparagine synthase (glutamine-hydrolysing)
MTFMDLNLRLPELLLMRVDKMSMAVALEARVPFLDHELVELALSIPESVKTANGELKGVLRHAVRGLIPDFVLDRPKQGFGVPLNEWLLDRVGDGVRDELAYFCRASGLLDSAETLRVFDTRDGHRVFPLLNLALWWRRVFGDGRGLASTAAPTSA